MNFEDQFTPVPADRVSSGFIGIGQDEQELEEDVVLQVAPDGSVWAKVCKRVDQLPLSVDYKAWGILADAEEAFKVKSTAEGRATYGKWPAPVEIEDYMMWIRHEIEIQEDQFRGRPDEGDHKPYLEALRGVYRELGLLGFYANRPPWKTGVQCLRGRK